MKGIISFILLILWVAFVGMGVSKPIVHAGIEVSDKSTCHSKSEPAEQKDDCCKKFHKEDSGEDDCGTGEEKEKDCCNDNNCPRTCCHIQIAFSSETDHESNKKFISTLTHNTHPSPNLPSPFLENSCPPPNDPL
jgi:hypothetical protein